MVQISSQMRVRGVSGGYLDSRQHDGDQVVVWEEQGTNNAAVPYVLDDGWGHEPEQKKRITMHTQAHTRQALRLNSPIRGLDSYLICTVFHILHNSLPK